MTYKIASWNVNSIKARLDHARAWLESESPDVLFLQELKGEICPDISPDYTLNFVGQKAYNGVAILTKGAAQMVLDHLPEDDLDTQARYLEVDWRGVRLINIYLPNGNPIDTDKFSYKIKWMKRLLNRISELRAGAVPFLIGGDFNVIPDEKDCYDPAAWAGDALFSPEARGLFRAMIHQGLVDAYRVIDHQAGAYTFWDYQAGAWPRNNGIRIDHFLLSPLLADRLVTVRIDKTPRGWDQPSDHTPIIIEISDE
ncbi:MAG: exodeoxyribonuclease III [Pseudobdellovibrionaceae bacterium]